MIHAYVLLVDNNWEFCDMNTCVQGYVDLLFDLLSPSINRVLVMVMFMI